MDFNDKLDISDMVIYMISYRDWSSAGDSGQPF